MHPVEEFFVEDLLADGVLTPGMFRAHKAGSIEDAEGRVRSWMMWCQNSICLFFFV